MSSLLSKNGSRMNLLFPLEVGTRYYLFFVFEGLFDL